MVVHPAVLAGYIVAMGVTGFAEGCVPSLPRLLHTSSSPVAETRCVVRIRGLPWWLQLLLAVLLVATLGFLALTHYVDPGVIPPSAIKGARTHAEPLQASLPWTG